MAHSAASPRSKTRPSALARPEFKWEPFEEVLDELWPLLKRHYAEIGRHYEGAPLDPDFDRYFEYARAGLLRVWTARAPNGALIGYIGCLVIHGLHAQSVLRCYADVIWLEPEWRDGLLGYRFIRSCLVALKEIGVKVARWETNDMFEPGEDGVSRVSALLRRLRFAQIGTVFQRAL